MSEEVDHMSSAISRCNENMQLKRELMVKNDRAMQDIDYQVPLKGRTMSGGRASVHSLQVPPLIWRGRTSQGTDGALVQSL